MTKSLDCPICKRADFRSGAALKSHMGAKHPAGPEVPAGQFPTLASLSVPDNVEPGLQPILCPTCKQQATVFVKDDHTIASSSEIPKTPSSGLKGRGIALAKRGTHSAIVSARYKMRWNSKESRWKRTVAMMGTHGKTAPDMPWHELGVDERWLLNDSHGIHYVSPHVK